MLTVFFDRDSQIPMYEQLYNYIKTAIENDELKANEKLPSKRKLATHLKVSVITVETAYNQLMAEGYIKSQPKKGFFVLPYVRLTKIPKRKKTSLVKKDNLKENYLFDFKTNQIDESSFPYEKWAKIEKEVLLYTYQKNINKTDYQGIGFLRERISEILFEYRGIEANPDSIVIGSGSEHLISLLILLLGRDTIYGVEEPGYIKNYRLYNDYGAKAKTVELDEFGLDLSKVQDCNIIHVTPSHQFPLGIVTPIARRMELLNWAYENDSRYIIEDDYDSEFRFSGNPIPALKSLDVHDRVIYMNSFSKSIAPTLRVSFMVLPDRLTNLYREHYSYFTCSVPVITQLVLGEFIKEKEYERHLNRMKNVYKNKRDIFIECLKTSKFSDKLEVIGEEAGLHFLVNIDTTKPISSLVEAAKRQSVRVYGIDEYCINKNFRNNKKTIIFGYSHLTESDFFEAIKRLEIAWFNIL
jgi:GntR family transcriptional regulator/MocR family aminotransferase